MNQEIKIRQLSKKDVEKYKIEISNYIYESVRMSNYEESYTKEQSVDKAGELCSYVKEEKAIVIGAFDMDEMIGFLWAYKYPFREDLNRLYISILHVMERYRDNHIGTKLITFIEEVARTKGIEKVYLHAEASNAQACGFYESKNYIKERIQYVKNIRGTQSDIEKNRGGTKG